MTETEGDVAFGACVAFVDQLVQEGLEHACLSPGSRSTPIALALWRHPHVRVHVHLDERAAAFFGLGLAKSSARPVAVACTSGTAAAELLPAVVEASMSRTPLILLTADRPPELRGVGANQTIDQVKLFGRYAKWFVDAPVPGEAPSRRRWRSLATRAFDRARGWPPGPVHVNLPFREPLVPSAGAEVQARTPPSSTGGTFGRPDELEDLVREVRNARPGVILVGSLRRPAPALTDLALRLRWPIIAEPTSGIRVPGTLAAGQFLLSSEAFVGDHEPSLVLQVGAAPTSRAGLELAARAGRLIVVDPDRLVADPMRRASWTIEADAEILASQARDRLHERPSAGWLEGWLEADAIARASVDALIDGWDDPYEGRIARDVAAWMPDGSTLVVGSSMPVRDLDTYMAPRDGLRVLANRGASGIDGFVSTALGVAASGAPTAALCGDLTLLHDVGSLLWSSRRGHDCVFVVPNNDGGAIFSFLPQGELPELEELFTTPHGLDLAAVCAAAGARHARVERADDLVPAVEGATADGGVHVVELPIDREANVRRHADVHEAVATALAGAG